jgi:glycosyltransferase involved in cell wall biosynthesis
MSNKNILYLTYDGLTDPLGQSQILPYLVGLRKLGHRITIISFEKKERQSYTQQIVRICQEADIHWIPLQYHKSPPIFSTIFDLLYLKKVCTKLLRQQSFDWIHARSYLMAMVASRITRKSTMKFLFDMRGFWADERVEGGLWNLRNPIYRLIYRFFKSQEQVLLRKAAAVVVLTQAAQRVLKEWSIKDKVSVIPCCVDEELFNPDKVDADNILQLRKSWGADPNTFVFLYLGSLGTWYMYHEMVAFFDRIKKQLPNAKFLFLTNDAHVVESRPDFIVRSATREEVPNYIAACQAAVCFIKPSFSKLGSSATKMAEILVMRKVVFTNKHWGDVDYLNNIIPQVVTVDLDELAFDIRYISENQTFNKELFSDLFGLNSGISKYHDIYIQKNLR